MELLIEKLTQRLKLKELLDKFKLDKNAIKVLKNSMSFHTYPFLWQDFHNTLLNDAIQAGVIVEEKEKIVYKTSSKNEKKTQTETKAKAPSKKIIFKNAKAMSYQSLGGVENDSLNFTENKLLNQKEFEFEKEITTSQGESFIKVKGENLYFSTLDVKLEESKE